MDFALSEEQDLVAETARRFLESEISIAYVRDVEDSRGGLDSTKWMKMAQLGWHELGPEADTMLLDLCVLNRELGAALTPGPYAVNALCGYVIATAGDDDQRGRFLPGLTNGTAIHTYAVAEGTGAWSPDEVTMTATARDDGLVLTGKKFYVPDCVDASFIHVFAKTPEGSMAVFMVPREAPGVELIDVKAIGGDRQSNIVFTDVFVPASDVMKLDDRTVNDVWNVANCLECAYLVGLADRNSALAIEYAKTREQFNKPIGSFQAIQQKCTDSAVDLDGMELLMHEAAWAVQVKEPNRDVVVAMAKAWCSDASRRIVWRSQQIHGASGFTERSDIQLFFRRQRRPAFFWGTAEHFRRVVESTLGWE